MMSRRKGVAGELLLLRLLVVVVVIVSSSLSSVVLAKQDWATVKKSLSEVPKREFDPEASYCTSKEFQRHKPNDEDHQRLLQWTAEHMGWYNTYYRCVSLIVVREPPLMVIID